MDEKLKELLDSVQRTAATAAATATDAAETVGRKASALLSVGKLNVRIMDLQGQIGLALREVGSMIYATHTGNPSDSDVLLEKLQGIDALNEQLAALRAELARARGASVCPACGAAAEKGDEFCRSCGAKL